MAYRLDKMLAFAVLGCVLSACEPAVDRPQDVTQQTQTEVATVEPSENSEVVEGYWEMSDAAGPYRAYLDHGVVVRIEQELDFGDYGSSRTEFFFEDGRLIRFHERSERRVITPGRASELLDIEIELDFDQQGRYASGRKTVNRKPTEPDEHEVRAAHRHAHELVTRIHGNGESHYFRCQGNEPFWNIEIVDGRATYTALAEPEGPRDFGGELTQISGETPQSWEWRGFDSPKMGPELIVSIIEQTCLDTMSDETPPFSHRARVTLPEGEVLTGCCRTTKAEKPARAGLDLTALPVADLASKPPEDWSRRLLELMPGIEACVLEVSGSAPHVTKAWPLDHEMIGVRLGNGEGGRFECIFDAGAGMIARFESLPGTAERLPGEHRVIFSPAAQYPMAGGCYEHERAIDESGELVGWLSYDVC